MIFDEFDDFDDFQNSEDLATADVCPSCGIILVHGNFSDKCNDPSGCGFYVDHEPEEEEEELLEELNFDD